MFAFVTLCLTISQPVAGLPGNLTQRDISSGSLSDYRGALFVVASTQTSCEMALIDSNAGFVAASCLSYKSDGKVDNNIDYRVAINGIGSEKSSVNSVTMVDAHPNYNPSTYANNIAVLHWGDPYKVSWHQDIGQDRPAWDSTFYTRRTMSSVSDASWSTPSVLTLFGSDAVNGCSSASNLYNSNKDWFLCIAQTTKSIANSNCQTPYGAVWGAYQSDSVAVAAIYSHSSIYDGSELCGSTGNQYHYYTMLQPYVEWASKMTGRKVYTYAADSSYSYDGSSSFKMENDLAPAVFGVTTVSGDLYPGAKAYKGPSGGSSNSNDFANGGGTSTTIPADDDSDTNATSASDKDNDDNKDNDGADASDDSALSEDSTDDSSDSDKSIGDDNSDNTNDIGNANNNDDANKDNADASPNNGGSDRSGYGVLSRGAIIAISTIVPIVTIAILVGLFFAYKWWKKRRNVRNWDPKNEINNIECIRIIDNFGEQSTASSTIDSRVESVRASCPPAYIEHEFGAVSTRTSKMPL
ncbi:hypothetical protein H4R20_000117 [Coemansia guatemalensis]|uniref:Peptidase S1 domain-containing protein n=1 Tax=Coemansia guatemalensis TaxID=2761395 RepID=A0A9W8LUF2_9FUNG|nr:hypothetical protein H4R20_000117 [Coemansia guatemalensis]